MTKQTINIGTAEQAGDGESVRSAFIKVNENFTELYASTTDPTQILNGYSSVRIPEENGNIYITAYGETEWSFDPNGVITLPMNGQIRKFDGTLYFDPTPPGNITLQYGSQLSEVTWSSSIVDIVLGHETFITLANEEFQYPEFGQITITGIEGPTDLNGMYYYQATGADQFKLYYSEDQSNSVDSTGWTTYIGGGTVTLVTELELITNNNRWKFSQDGSTSFPPGGKVIFNEINSSYIQSGQGFRINSVDNIYINAAGYDGPYSLTNRTWGFGTDGVMSYPDETTTTGATVITGGNYNIQSIGNTVIQTRANASAFSFTFGNDGMLTIPNIGIKSYLAASDGYYTLMTAEGIESYWDGSTIWNMSSGPGGGSISTTNGKSFGIFTSDMDHQWLFDQNGRFMLPPGGTITTYDGTNILANMLTSVPQPPHTVLAGPEVDKIYQYTNTCVNFDGFTINQNVGLVQIDEANGNAAPSFNITHGNNSFYADFGQTWFGKTIEFDYMIEENAQGGISFGCDNNGGGGISLTLGTGSNQGLGQSQNWLYTGGGENTNTLTPMTWYHIKVVIGDGSVNSISYYINGSLAGNTTQGYSMGSGTWWGFIDNGGTIWFDNIVVYSPVIDASPEFRHLVAADLPSLDTITYTPANPADWTYPYPTNIQSALDRLAALLKVLNAGNGA